MTSTPSLTAAVPGRILVLAILISTGACEREEAGTAPEPPLAIAATLSGLEVGKDEDPSPAEERVRRDFAVGEPLLLTVDVVGAAADSSVGVRWLGSDGVPIASETRTVRAPEATLRFRVNETFAWTPGFYVAEVSVDGQVLDRQPLRIVEVARGPPESPADDYVAIDVYYATDRALSGTGEYESFFGAERAPAGKLSLGVCTVSVPLPPIHRIGEVERPRWWRLEFEPDPRKHVSIVRLAPLPEALFHGRLETAVGESDGKEVLVFIHGFNVSFTEAVLRTAQIAHDLAPFDGIPVTYSWPSQGRLALAHYYRDASNVEWTIPHLETFLTELARRSGASAIHLVAHSMGNLALTNALRRIAARRQEIAKPVFNQIVLTAPDVDADVFADLAREFTRLGERTTLYASSNDRALQIARQVRGGLPRAGDSGDHLVLVPGIDTIDVSAVDTSLVGHFYYGDNRSILFDLFHLLRDGQPPQERPGLTPRERTGSRYWEFRP